MIEDFVERFGTSNLATKASSVMAAEDRTAFAQVTPKKWWQVYQGDGECRLFKELARGIHEWRTTAGLAKAAKLKIADVEAICAKYVPLGVIDQRSGKWRYWERAKPKTEQAAFPTRSGGVDQNGDPFQR